MVKSKADRGGHKKKLLLLGTTIALLLILMEGTARIWLIATGRSLPVPRPFKLVEGVPHKHDPLIGQRLVEGFRGEAKLAPRKPAHYVEINQQGFRSSTDYAPYTPGANQPRNVIMLGDSMVYGLYADQEIILTEVLNHVQTDYTFINTGMSGYNTAQEYLILEQILDTYQPAVVFLFYTHANDTLRNIRPDTATPAYQLVDDRLVFTPPLDMMRPNFLEANSALYHFSRVRFKGRDLKYLWRRSGLALRGENAYAWRVTAGILGKFKPLLAPTDTRMIVMDIPTRRQLSGKLASRQRQRLLRETSHSLGFEYHELEQVYAKVTSDVHSLFIEKDSHWNKAGHQLIADEVMRILKSPPADPRRTTPPGADDP